METNESLLNEVEQFLQKKYKEKTDPEVSQLPSNAEAAPRSPRIDQLILPPEDRPKMPLTKDKFVIRENEQLVAWERVVRQFLRNLTPNAQHRVSAVMIYEWATGIKVTEYQEQHGGQAPPDLRKINKLMRGYFGQAYSTYIAGRKVANCYKIKQGYYIKRHAPQTITLWMEWRTGVLNP